MYCRKSSESEERQVLSIESQVKELSELAARLNITVSEILTESQSAKCPGRPVFNALMGRVYRREITGIIVWKLDRLSRNPIDGSAVIWAIDQSKLERIITPSASYCNNSNDKFVMNLDLGMAKKYVDDLSDNVKRGNRMKLEKGWLPGPAPTGYLNDLENKTIIPDPERFPLMRKMWDLLLNGTPPMMIHRIVNNEWGFRTRKRRRMGNKPLSVCEVYKIFRFPFYYGLITRKEGVFLGKHKKMITEEEFWKAQELLGRKGQPRSQTHEFAFTGLIRCGECGSMITAEEKDNHYGTHYVYYRCTKKKECHVCRQRYINLKKLEDQIADYLERIYVPKKLLDIALEYLAECAKQEDEDHQSVRKSQAKAINDCGQRITTLNRMRINNLIDDEEYLSEKKTLLVERMRLEEKAHGSMTGTETQSESPEEMITFASTARMRFVKGTIQEKRCIFRRIGSNFFLRDKKLTIKAKKAFVVLEKGLRGVGGENDWLELFRKGLAEPQISFSNAQIIKWHAVVEDVRTFLKQNQAAENIERRR
jgi:DNA invertase Pin-like site-specific DNA recombinase